MRPASLIFFSFSQKQIHLNSTWRSLSDHRFYCCNFFTYIFVLQRLSSLFTCYFYYPDYEILIFCTYNYLCKSTAFFFYLLCETPDLILPQWWNIAITSHRVNENQIRPTCLLSKAFVKVHTILVLANPPLLVVGPRFFSQLRLQRRNAQR